MRGRICVVTGANRGIGRETAIGLARMGARVAIVCRDRSRGEAARKAIREAAGGGEVDLFIGDLGSLESVRRLAAAIGDRLPALHVLVNNAGVVMNERRLSPDGFEMTFAVNHLGPFLLTHLLLDRLRACAPARIVNVSSDAHKGARFDLDDLQAENDYNGLVAYGNSKLANVLFTYALARRTAGTGVTANCLHPGVIRTGLLEDYVRGMPGWIRWSRPLLDPFFRTPERGAETSLHLAASPEVEGVSGKYFARRRERRSSRLSRDRELGEKFWEVSRHLAGL